MSSIEAGNRTRDGIQAEFLKRYPGSEGKSTFAVFFTDVVRPFGSSSVSRAIRIKADANGILSIDQTRALCLKAAIAKGLLVELTAIERNSYPKRDRASVDLILKKFGVVSQE